MLIQSQTKKKYYTFTSEFWDVIETLDESGKLEYLFSKEDEGTFRLYKEDLVNYTEDEIDDFNEELYRDMNSCLERSYVKVFYGGGVKVFEFIYFDSLTEKETVYQFKAESLLNAWEVLQELAWENEVEPEK